MKRLIVGVSLLGVLVAVLFAFTYAGGVLADDKGDSGGTTDKNSTKGCAPAGSTNYFDTCAGVSWRKYPSGSDFFSTARDRCGGMDYYVLGYERYNLSASNSTDGYAYLGVHVSPDSGYSVTAGEVNAGFSGSSGGVNYVSGLAGVVPWGEVSARFEMAESKGVTNSKWEDTNWFCYDSDWEAPEPEDCVDYATVERTIHVGAELGKTTLEGGIEYIGGGTSMRVGADVGQSVTVPVRHTISIWGDTFADIDGYTYKLQSSASVATSIGELNVLGSGGTKEINLTAFAGKTERSEAYAVNTVFRWVVKAEYEYEGIEQQEVPCENGETGKCFKGVRVTTCEAKPGYEKKYRYDKFSDTVTAGGSMEKIYVTLKVDEVTHPSENLGKGGITFAGETTEMKWDASKGYSEIPTRPTIAAQPVVFGIDVSADNNPGRWLAGHQYRNNVPCDQYIGNLQGYVRNGYGVGCSALDGWNADTSRWGTGASDTVVGKPSASNQINIKTGSKTTDVSNYVGQKYCLGFGYQYQYYAFVDGKALKPGNTYWDTYNAYCKVIAKKPMVDFWNGGVATNGGIKTRGAERSVVDETLANVFSNLGDKRMYSSWAEYLVAPFKGISGFSSGAGLSWGNDNSSILNWSSMTVTNGTSNESDLGKSGISANNLYQERLRNYLQRFDAEGVADPLAFSVTGGTQVAYVKGSLNITSDIKNDSTYDNVFQIARKVIFVDGDVSIEPNVTRIDAWIIAKGKIDTCNDFRAAGDGVADAETTGTEAWSQRENRVYATNATCNKKLEFNGPVIADRVILRRTGGADLFLDGGVANAEQAFSTPAEVFNLGGDDYLWAYAQSTRYPSSYTAGYSRELPPRY